MVKRYFIMGKKFYYHGKNNHKTPEKPAQRYSDEKMGIVLENLGVNVKTLELLAKNNINTAGDLSYKTEKDMFRIQGFNKKMLFELKDALKKNDMTFMPATEQKSDVAKSDDVKTEKGGKKGDKQQNVADGQKQAKQDKSEKFDKNDKTDKNDKSKKKNDQNKSKQNAKTETVEKLTEPLPVEKWRKIQKNGKWGFYDGFKTVIPAMYDEVFSFKEGLASVELDEKCGYIDSENNIVIPFDYETAMSFSEGYAAVCKTVKFGYINKHGEVVIPFEYDAATPFEEGEAKIKKDGKWGTITIDGVVKWI